MSLLPFLVIFNTTKVGFHSIKEVENLPKKLSQYQRKHFFHYSGNASHSKQDFSIRADSIQSISSLFYVFFRCHAILPSNPQLSSSASFLRLNVLSSLN